MNDIFIDFFLIFQYPKEIQNLEYIPNFAIRGLHYDFHQGLLLKLDSFLQIQLGSVHRGLTPLPDDEVLKIYKNRTIPIAYVEGDLRQASFILANNFTDIFS